MNLQKSTKKRNILTSISLLILLSIVVLFIVNNNKSQPEILAEVGNKVITKKDFLLNYEFGLPHLKIGKSSLERKENYLQFMINEYLLALDAEAKGLDNTRAVKYQTEKIKRELLLESIIENDIKPKIDISPDEIKEAINKSKVSFKFFYWPEKDLRNALIIKEMFEKNEMRKEGKEIPGAFAYPEQTDPDRSVDRG